MYRYLRVRSSFATRENFHFDREALYLVLQQTDKGVLAQSYSGPAFVDSVFVELFCQVLDLAEDVYKAYIAANADLVEAQEASKEADADMDDTITVQLGEEAVMAFIAAHGEDAAIAALKQQAEAYFARVEARARRLAKQTSYLNSRRYQLEDKLRKGELDRALAQLVRDITRFAAPYYRDGNLIVSAAPVPGVVVPTPARSTTHKYIVVKSPFGAGSASFAIGDHRLVLAADADSVTVEHPAGPVHLNYAQVDKLCQLKLLAPAELARLKAVILRQKDHHTRSRQLSIQLQGLLAVRNGQQALVEFILKHVAGDDAQALLEKASTWHAGVSSETEQAVAAYQRLHAEGQEIECEERNERALFYMIEKLLEIGDQHYADGVLLVDDGVYEEICRLRQAISVSRTRGRQYEDGASAEQQNVFIACDQAVNHIDFTRDSTSDVLSRLSGAHRRLEAVVAALVPVSS